MDPKAITLAVDALSQSDPVTLAQRFNSAVIAELDFLRARLRNTT
jgi:hypothetical protein